MANNVIVGGKVEGNIGGCNSNVAVADMDRTIFIQNTKTYVTNSCTGKVDTFYNWRFTDTGAFGIGSMVMVGILILFIIANKN